MTTFLTIQYTAEDKYGEKFVDVLPVEEIPDKPSWFYKFVRPIKYKSIMATRAEYIHIAMDSLLDICRENGFVKLSASIQWDEM